MKRLPQILVGAACALLVVFYFTNEDMAGAPDAPRGTGQYLPIMDRGDGHMLYLMARSTALDLDWNFGNDLAAFGDPWYQPIGPTGRKQIPHPIGPALIWTPFIWLAELGALVGNLFGADIPLHGYTLWHQRIVFLSSLAAGFLSVLLGLRVARRFIAAGQPGEARLPPSGGTWSPYYAAAAILLGTPIAYYASLMPSYGHALDAGACAAFLGVWALTLGRWSLRRWLLLGALLGVAMLIRQQDIALGIVVAIEVAAEIVRDLRKRAVDWRVRALIWIAGGAIVLAVACIVFFPQLLYWKLVYGQWFGLPQGARYVRPGSPMILELLFSARNGWLSSTPLAYFALIGLVCVPRRARFVAGAFAAAAGVQIYLNASIFDWWAMNSFGQRRLCSMTIVLVFGLAGLLWRCGRLRLPRAAKHAIAIAVLAPFVAWNVWRVLDLRGGKAPPGDVEPQCCEHVPEALRGTAQWFYDRIGDPFEFPANALFAWKHGVPLSRWDQAVGYYALVPQAKALADGSLWHMHQSWQVGSEMIEPYLVGEWSAPQGGQRGFRWTRSAHARLIVPNLMPYTMRFMLWVAPGGARDVAIHFDGVAIVHHRLHPGWQPIIFEIGDLAVGEHDLDFDSELGPFAGSPGLPRAEGDVGVGVSDLELELMPPS